VALRELSEPRNRAHSCSILGFRGGSCRQRAVVVIGSGDVATDASDGCARNSGMLWENGLGTYVISEIQNSDAYIFKNIMYLISKLM